MKRLLLGLLLVLPLYYNPIYCEQPAQEKLTKVETQNFVILCNDKDKANTFAKLAETYRTEIGKKWFGEDKKWDHPCFLHLYVSTEEMENATGASVGYTKIIQDNGIVEYRTIHMQIDGKNCENVLKHELTHAIISDKLGFKDYVPRWLDEGMACSSESEENYNKFKAIILRNKEKLYSTKDIMEMKDYPKRLDLFYGQSVMLVKILVSQKDEKKFVEFCREAAKGDTEAALKKCYDLTFEDLDKLLVK